MAPKLLIETTSSIMLVDPMSRDEVAFNRPSVVLWTSFLEGRLAIGQIRVVAADLKPETTDDDFVAVLAACDGQMELAIASFVSEFALEQTQGDKKPHEPTTGIVDKTVNPLTAKLKK